MVITKLKEGMTVYEVKKATGMRSFSGKWQTWCVTILKIDEEYRRVFASWNYNKPQWFYEKQWSKWRLNLPTD